MEKGVILNREPTWGQIQADQGISPVFFYPESVASAWSRYIAGRRVWFERDESGATASVVRLTAP